MSLADGFPIFKTIREKGLIKTLQERRGTRLRGIYKEIVRAEAQVKAEVEAEKRRPKISVVMGGQREPIKEIRTADKRIIAVADL